MGQIHSITAKEAQDLLSDGKAYLIDVREPAEYRAQKIPGSKSLPLSKISSSLFKKNKDESKKAILYCRSGKRSTMACNKLIKDIDSDLYNVDGGLLEWEKLGYPIEKSENKTLPLERQVQLSISLMILIGLLINMTVSSLGLILPLMAGLGLLNASLTGWCGMAMLLGKMPWNR
jgi:rhodanese-related sulfurtransferase